MDNEMAQVLLKRKEILSDELTADINNFLEYVSEEKPLIKIISGDERLKAKAVEMFSTIDSFNVEGVCITNEEIDDKELLIADYLIIDTSVLHMAPLAVTTAVEKVQRLNKRAFCIVDKWNTIPRTEENIERVRNNVFKNYASVDIQGIFFIYQSEGNKSFVSQDECRNQIVNKITNTFAETHNAQINKLYPIYIDKVNKEYLEVTTLAMHTKARIAEVISDLYNTRKANKIRFSNINATLINYSKDVYDKVKMITAEDCIGESDYPEYTILKADAVEQYVQLVSHCFDNVTEQILKNYRMRTVSYREELINETKLMVNNLRELKYLDIVMLDHMEDLATELKSVDEIISELRQLLTEETNKMSKKIRVVARNAFNEESIIDDLKRKLQTLKRFDQGDEISEDEKRIERENILRKQFCEIIESSNLKVFSFIDEFVYDVKHAACIMSDKIVDSYYNRLEKVLIELEEEVGKVYVIK